jgi:hypothetical protein
MLFLLDNIFMALHRARYHQVAPMQSVLFYLALAIVLGVIAVIYAGTRKPR